MTSEQSRAIVRGNLLLSGRRARISPFTALLRFMMLCLALQRGAGAGAALWPCPRAAVIASTAAINPSNTRPSSLFRKISVAARAYSVLLSSSRHRSAAAAAAAVPRWRAEGEPRFVAGDRLLSAAASSSSRCYSGGLAVPTRPVISTGDGTSSVSNDTMCCNTSLRNDRGDGVIDGLKVAAMVREEVAQAVRRLEHRGVRPHLAVILVGDRKDSATYVRMKKKACADIGIQSTLYTFSEDATQEELLKLVERLNADGGVHGVLVQLPLPPHIEEAAVLEAVAPSKDVDGLHSENMARLLLNIPSSKFSNGARLGLSTDFYLPCTPQGCIELLDKYGVVIEGKEAVVIGRSNMVGIPVALLLMQRNATVTIAHSRTRDIEEVVRRADIVVAAVGRAEMVKASWIKPGAVVIDVGINSVDDSSKKAGYRLVGDVDFAGCREVASLITPVPGGVGPMTIAMLLRNTVNSAIRALEKSMSIPDPNDSVK